MIFNTVCVLSTDTSPTSELQLDHAREFNDIKVKTEQK